MPDPALIAMKLRAHSEAKKRDPLATLRQYADRLPYLLIKGDDLVEISHAFRERYAVDPELVQRRDAEQWILKDTKNRATIMVRVQQIDTAEGTLYQVAEVLSYRPSTAPTVEHPATARYYI